MERVVSHECTKHRPGSDCCYIWDRCRCPECTSAHSRGNEMARLRKLRGQSNLIAAAGTQRRIRALCVTGWSYRAIAEQAGLCKSVVSRLAREDLRTVNVATAKFVREIYDEMWRGPQILDRPAARARGDALRKGWVPPLSWDDGAGPHGIDNPDATPVVATGRRDMIGEIRHLASQGAGIQELMAQLGVTRSAIDKACRRAGDPELWQKITREAA